MAPVRGKQLGIRTSNTVRRYECWEGFQNKSCASVKFAVYTFNGEHLFPRYNYDGTIALSPYLNGNKMYKELEYEKKKCDVLVEEFENSFGKQSYRWNGRKCALTRITANIGDRIVWIRYPRKTAYSSRQDTHSRSRGDFIREGSKESRAQRKQRHKLEGLF